MKADRPDGAPIAHGFQELDGRTRKIDLAAARNAPEALRSLRADEQAVRPLPDSGRQVSASGLVPGKPISYATELFCTQGYRIFPPPMPHAHLTVNHLLKQLETHRERNASRTRRPAWLTDVIHAAADLFDPANDLGRVGYQSHPTEFGWVALLYLGGEEFVGGAHDGRTEPADFRFDVLGVTRLFETVTEVAFDAFPSIAAETDLDDPTLPPLPAAAGVRLTVRGTVAGNPLTMHVHAMPPETAGPGFRRYPNGRREVSE